MNESSENVCSWQSLEQKRGARAVGSEEKWGQKGSPGCAAAAAAAHDHVQPVILQVVQ